MPVAVDYADQARKVPAAGKGALGLETVRNQCTNRNEWISYLILWTLLDHLCVLLVGGKSR